MRPVAKRIADLLSYTPTKQGRFFSFSRISAFDSTSAAQAETTNGTTQRSLRTTTNNNMRSEAAALLGLDTKERDARDIARGNEALLEARARLAESQSTREKNAAILRTNKGLERMSYRRWRAGDVYTPHDLTPRELKYFKDRQRPSKDIFDALGMNPMDSYKNPVMLAEFMTAAGKIKHPRETGLRPVNQRKIAKAIRRAMGMGLIPKCHVHPEMLRRLGPDSRTQNYQWH